MIIAVTAVGFFGVAVQLGKKTNAMEVCKFLDQYIQRYFPDKHDTIELLPYNTRTTVHSQPRSQINQLLAKIVNEAKTNKISRETDRERAIRRATTRPNKARPVGVSLAKPVPVPVVISYKGKVGKDRKTITHSGFQINHDKQTINLKEYLDRLAPDGLEFNVTVLHPAEALIQAVAIQEKDLLRAGDQIYSANIDTGMSGASGTITADGTLTQISVNDKAGHEKMPYVEKFKLIEGEREKKGHVALYITANDPDNRSGKKRGLMATVENFKKLKNLESNATLSQAVKLLNDTLKENGVKDCFTITNQDVLDSSIINTNRKFSDQEIIQAAKEGDKFAQALVIFTLIRVSQALAQSINSQIPNKQPSGNFDESPPPINSDKPVKLVFVTSSFNRDLSEVLQFRQGLELQSRVIQSELKRLGHLGISCPGQSLHHFNPDLDGTPLIVQEQLTAEILKDLRDPPETAQ